MFARQSSSVERILLRELRIVAAALLPRGREQDHSCAVSSRDQPSAMNRFASQSSNSGCVGGADWLPRSSGVLTKPSPK